MNRTEEIMETVVKKLYGQTYEEYAKEQGVSNITHDVAIIDATLQYIVEKIAK